MITNTARVNELIAQANLPAHGITREDLQELIRLVVEDCIDVCNHVAAEADGTAKSQFVTENGKLLHQGMWGGATNCAGVIRYNYGVE